MLKTNLLSEIFKYEFLNNSPVIEGNLFLQFKNKIELPELKKVSEWNHEGVTVSEIKNYNIDATNLKSKDNVKSTIDIVGFRIEDKNLNSVTILRKNDILVSMKEPYEGWSKLERKFSSTIDNINYKSEIDPRFVGCRFINRFKIRISNNFKIEDYFNVNLQFKNSYISSIHNYAFRFTHKKDELQATVNFALDQDLSNNYAIITFDIEVIKPVQKDDLISGNLNLNKIRDFKNYIFHKSLTEKTLNLFR